MREESIRAALGPTEIVGRSLRVLDTVDSTNTYLRCLAAEGAPEGTVVLADRQTGGRGRMGRSFESPRGLGIYLTVLLRPGLPGERLLPLTALAGVAVCNAVERVCGLRPGVKWPNDPVLGNRKICGILTELDAAADGGIAVALGIGINVHQQPGDFTPEVAALASSLDQETGSRVSRSRLTAALLEELDRMYAALNRGELTAYREALRRDCVNLGKPVQLIGPDGRREAAVALDIDEQFGLVVRDETGAERVIRSGEVSVRGLYGYMETE